MPMCLGIRPLEKGILKTNVGIMLAGWCFCVLPQLWTSPDASNNQQNHNCVCVKVLVLNRTWLAGLLKNSLGFLPHPRSPYIQKLKPNLKLKTKPKTNLFFMLHAHRF